MEQWSKPSITSHPSLLKSLFGNFKVHHFLLWSYSVTYCNSFSISLINEFYRNKKNFNCESKVICSFWKIKWCYWSFRVSYCFNLYVSGCLYYQRDNQVLNSYLFMTNCICVLYSDLWRQYTIICPLTCCWHMRSS